MNGQDARIGQLLKADAPPARDMAFEIAVLAKLERKRFRRQVLGVMAMMLLAVPLLALMAPFAEEGAGMLTPLLLRDQMMSAALVLAGMAACWPFVARVR